MIECGDTMHAHLGTLEWRGVPPKTLEAKAEGKVLYLTANNGVAVYENRRGWQLARYQPGTAIAFPYEKCTWKKKNFDVQRPPETRPPTTHSLGTDRRKNRLKLDWELGPLLDWLGRQMRLPETGAEMRLALWNLLGLYPVDLGCAGLTADGGIFPAFDKEVDRVRRLNPKMVAITTKDKACVLLIRDRLIALGATPLGAAKRLADGLRLPLCEYFSVSTFSPLDLPVLMAEFTMLALDDVEHFPSLTLSVFRSMEKKAWLLLAALVDNEWDPAPALGGDLATMRALYQAESNQAESDSE